MDDVEGIGRVVDAGGMGGTEEVGDTDFVGTDAGGTGGTDAAEGCDGCGTDCAEELDGVAEECDEAGVRAALAAGLAAALPRRRLIVGGLRPRFDIPVKSSVAATGSPSSCEVCVRTIWRLYSVNVCWFFRAKS